MNQKILIYPYTTLTYSLIYALSFSRIKREFILVSPKGWGYDGKSVLLCEGKINIQTEFEKNCDKCDEVWFVNTYFDVNEPEMIYPKVRFAMTKRKAVRYFRDLNSEIKKILGLNKREKIINSPTKLELLNTPIVFIAGLYEECNAFDVEVRLNHSFNHEKYKITQIGSMAEGELIGMKTFPSFMFNKRYSEKEKILLFNQFIKEIELKEQPDLIIVGIPGGISSYSRQIVENFGMLFQLVSIAVSNDIFILSIPYNEYTDIDIENLKKFIWKKYEVHVDFINLAAKKIISDTSLLTQKLTYLTLDNDLVMQKTNQLGRTDMYVINVEEEADRLQKAVLNKLSNFGEIEML